MDSATPPPHPRAPLIVRVLLPFVAAIALFVLAWLAVTRLAPADRWGQILVGAVVFIAASLVLGRLVKNRPDLRLPMRVGVLTAAVIAVGGLYWTAFRDTVVDEDVAVAAAPARSSQAPAAATPPPAADAEPDRPATTAATPMPAPPPKRNVQLASGAFRGVDNHGGRGTATAIELAEGGRVVTFTDFDVDAGPRVVVHLARDEVYGDDTVRLGDLKGNVGNQQYAIPDGVDLSTYDTVILWCEPFAVRIAVAPLA